MSSARMPSRSSSRTRISSRPRLGAEDAGRQRQTALRAGAGLGQRLAEPDRVRRRAGQDVRPQVPDQSDLARRHAAGDRDHGRAELDGALVDAEAAGEQAVAVRVVHEAGRRGPGSGQRPRAHPGPQLQVGPGVGDQRRAAAGAARAVHGHDLLARHRQQPERVGIPQVALGGASAAGAAWPGSPLRRRARPPP